MKKNVLIFIVFLVVSLSVTIYHYHQQGQELADRDAQIKTLLSLKKNVVKEQSLQDLSSIDNLSGFSKHSEQIPSLLKTHLNNTLKIPNITKEFQPNGMAKKVVKPNPLNIDSIERVPKRNSENSIPTNSLADASQKINSKPEKTIQIETEPNSKYPNSGKLQIASTATTGPPPVSKICLGRPITMLICVTTRRNETETREAIRETWGSWKNGTWEHGSRWYNALVFFVGERTQQEDPLIEEGLRKESATYGDISFGSYIDTYVNLTYKSIAMMEFAAKFCRNSMFVFKVDSDSYVNIPLLMNLLKKMVIIKGHRPFMLGMQHFDVNPVRDPQHKFYISIEEYGSSKFPPYLGGSAYVLTSAAAVKISEVVAQVPWFRFEDIYITAMCRIKAGIRMIHDPRFQFIKEGRFNATLVFNKWVTGISFIPDELRFIHSKLTTKVSHKPKQHLLRL